MINQEERIAALAQYLEIDPDSIEEGYAENLFELEDGREFFVFEEDEVFDAIRDEIQNIFDDLGLSSFTPRFQEWILENAVDDDFVEEVFAEEMDLMEDDSPAAAKELRDAMVTVDQQREYLQNSWGIEEFGSWAARSNALDFDAITKEALNWDGAAHFIAFYDGKEINLGNGLCAYRRN